MRNRLIATVLLLAGFAATPALAQATIAVPEPSSLLLLGLGVAGVVIGRHNGHRQPRD